jgi:hypothetical protein
MTILEQQSEHSSAHYQDRDDKPVAVAVITSSGFYPDEYDYNRSYRGEIVGHVLERAKNKLNLKDTADWVAEVENRPIDPSKSFAQNGLHGIVEIEWGKPEGGGGASSCL